MYRYNFNKLIRNKLPAKMKKEQVIVHAHNLSKEQYIHHLKAKIKEEAEEVSEASDRQELAIELADVLEVIDALAKAADIDMKEILQEKQKKGEINGVFSPDCYIDYVEFAEDNYPVIDYMKKKKRHYVLS